MKLTGFRGSGGDDDGVLQRIIFLKSLDKLSNGRSLLSNGNVDAVELLGLIVTLVPSVLVDHGVKCDGGLASLTIANDQLTLSTSDWYHGVDGLETGLHGLVDGLAGQDTRGLPLGTEFLLCVDWALAVDWVAESVDDTTKELLADWNFDLGVC